MSVDLFIKLFHLLLFLLLCGTLLCGHVCANGGQEAAVSEKTVNLFKEAEEIKGLEASQTTKQVKDYYSPFFVKTGDVLVALAGVDRIDTDKRNINILTKHFDTSKDNKWKETVIGDSSSAGGWKTELLVRKGDQTGSKPSVAKGFIAVANDAKEIYFLLVNCTNEDGSQPTKAICKFKIDVGKINGETIAWTDPGSSSITNVNELKLQLEKNLPSDNHIFGTAFLTHEQKIIFVLQTKATENKNITALVRSKDANNNQFEVLSTEKLSESCHPYIFPWNEKLIKFTPDCNNKKATDIKESTDMGGRWDEIKEPFSLLTGFLVDKRDFTTATIKDDELIFFTQDIELKMPKGDANKYLWISNSHRAAKVGEITFNSENTAHLALLYHKEILFLFAQNCKQDTSKKVCLTRLDEHMTRIENVLSVWKTNNKDIQIPCTDAPQLASSCSTDGLVDFLSGTKGDNSQLKSKFLNVDATIHNNGEVKDNNGVKFSGAGAGAVWPIVEQNNNQPYNLIASGFTLVATVTIESNDEEKGNSLLGMVLKKETKHIGLWCSGGKKWIVKNEKGTLLKESQNPCEKGKTYTVAFVLEKEGNKGFVYIDWEKMTGLDEVGKIQEKEITHFYFGADKDTPTAKTDVTITNVLLYNKPFKQEQINQLQIMAKERNKQNTPTIPEDKDDKLRKSAESTTDNDNPLDTPETSTIEETQSPSPPPTTEDNAVRVDVVGVLCFMLFGVFTLLGRHVY